MAKMGTVKCKTEDWTCDACGNSSKSTNWEIMVEDIGSSPSVKRDIVVLICPECKGSNVYEFAYHSHIKRKDL